MMCRDVFLALVATAAFARAACDTAQQRVLVWGTSTNGLGDVESILAIGDFVSTMHGHPTVIILVANDVQYGVVEAHLRSSAKGGYVKVDDVAQYVSERVNLVRHFLPNWGWTGICDEIMQKKEEVEEKMARISTSFDRSVCFFNHACVFVPERVFVTPESRSDRTLRIDEYSGRTTTLWLKQPPASSEGDYYFAYFHDDYCKTLARFIVTLRRFLQTPKKTVRIVTNVRYNQNDVACAMKYLFDKSGWCSSSGKHWTECNPGVEEMLRNNGVVIHDTENVEVHGVLFVLEKIGRVSAEEFDSLLFNSGKYVGCTGDSSLSKALSSKRVPLYQVLSHKEEFAELLRRMWTEAGGDGQSFDAMMLRPYGKLSFQRDTDYDAAAFEAHFNRFVEKLFAQTTQHVLEKYLRTGEVPQ